MKWESSFNTDLEAYFSNGKGFTNTFALTASYNSLENLDTRAATLDDVYVDLDGVTGAKLYDVGLE